MLQRFRKGLATTAGRAVAVVLVAGAVAVAALAVRGFLRGETPEDALSPMFVCTETGKTFRHELRLGESLPVRSPHSGKDTGVQAEACYWTADGKVKADPTWVLLNEAAGRPGPTFCPDCGRLVVGRNPQPGPDAKPPPTAAEFKARPPRDPRPAGPSRDDR